jgi:hypothetical protein
MATNVAEDVIFIVEARNVKHHAGELPETAATAPSGGMGGDA